MTHLARLPALTSDGAWLGLFALRSRGLPSPHEMNTYTGPLYGLFVSWIFAARGVSLESLRLFGAVANAAAFLIVVAGLRRRVSAEAAAWGAALLAGSAYLLLKSRLAWECYAVQPLLLAVTLSLVDEPVNALRALIFTSVTLFGVQNHFIYLSIPVSLCVLYGARAAWLGEVGGPPLAPPLARVVGHGRRRVRGQAAPDRRLLAGPARLGRPAVPRPGPCR